MLERPSIALLLSSLALAACGGPSPAATPDAPPSKFVGTWTYQPGSAIEAQCADASPQTIDLSDVPGTNKPGFFILTDSGEGALHEVDARGCQYDWSVSGDVASAAAGQSCSTFPDGRGGTRLVHMTQGTKSTSDGTSMTVDVQFTTDAPSSCAIRVRGNATKS
jgi:hypothetical protein